MHHHLDQNILPTPKEGTRKDQEDPVIYNDEIELLSQGIKDKLDILAKIANKIENIEKEETKIRNEVHQMLQKSKKEHGELAQRLVNIDNLYQLLAELERDLVDLRRQGNKTPSERKTRCAESEAPSKEQIEAVVTELQNCSP